MAIIGGYNSDVSLQMATMLDIYKIPQVQLMSVNVFCGMNVFIHGFEYKLFISGQQRFANGCRKDRTC